MVKYFNPHSDVAILRRYSRELKDGPFYVVKIPDSRAVCELEHFKVPSVVLLSVSRLVSTCLFEMVSASDMWCVYASARGCGLKHRRVAPRDVSMPYPEAETHDC